MAAFKIDYFSNALHRMASFEMWIPNDVRTDVPPEPTPYNQRPMKTLFVLHGYTGKAENWIPAELQTQYNFAVVSLNAENSFYLDGLSTGHAFETLVAIELVDYIRKTFGLAMRPEDTYITGLSMGGFGAIHTGLAHPDRFGKIGAMSSALIIHQIAKMTPEVDNPVANYYYYHECFGDLDTVEERDCNPEVLVKKLKSQDASFPELYLCCGTEDFLIEPNRAFHRFLEDEHVPHEYHESPGQHDMVFWQEYARKIVAWMFA